VHALGCGVSRVEVDDVPTSSESMMRHRSFLASVVLLLAGPALVGCADESTEATPSAPASSSAADAVLAEHGLNGLDARELIDRLDRAERDEKPGDLFASVRPDELLVQDTGDPDQEHSLPIEDGFYLSVAPYVENTHECFHHSLTTCQGELVEEDIDVTITDTEGEVLVDETVTTYPNGFAGFWLPRDVEATMEVRYDGRSAETEIATGPGDPTCLTTVQLT
jgi:hypothetical protein